MPSIVRPLAQEDLPSVLEIASDTPEVAQWSRESYSSLLERGAKGWVATEENSILGFLVLRGVSGEAEILNLAVKSVSRRKGIGSLLLTEALRWAARNRIATLHLEVRASNHAARKFYEARGFQKSVLRRGYYSNPPDDAVLLSRAVAEK